MIEELPQPWEEEPPDVPAHPHGELLHLTPIELVEDIGRLARELDRAGRVLATRISRAARAKSAYQLEFDKKLVAIRVDGKRTAVDERRAMIHGALSDELRLNAEISQGLVESSRAYVRSLENQLSAKQSQLKAMTAVDLLPEGLAGDANAPWTTYAGRSPR